jgi:4,5-DOPA dioxygenase extradiol
MTERAHDTVADAAPDGAPAVDRMPVLYLSHGAPPLADDKVWTGQLSQWGKDLPKPSSILVVSAHWEAAPVTIGATEQVPLTYDFWGFPERYYQVQYRAPGAPDLATRVAALVARPGQPIHQDPNRGLDHGAYVPLVEMYPDADVPVLQVSMPTEDPRTLLEIGRRLAPLRDEGVLIMGSGFLTHSFEAFHEGRTPRAIAEFDAWAAEALARRDLDTLLDYRRTAPGLPYAHRTVDHFVPLFIALGASLDNDAASRTAIDGFWFGNSKRSVEFN